MDPHFFLAPPGQALRLAEHDPAYTGAFTDEEQIQERMRETCGRLRQYQDMLLAQESHALLLIFQGMDASGKDETIQAVFSHLDPQSCQAFGFQKPVGEELRHDFLWRFIRRLPERGKIGVFNRSYYEEVLSTRVHPERLEEQHLPAAIPRDDSLWRQRFTQINHFEQYLTQNGIGVVKFFLHVSKTMQKKRLLERLEQPQEQWKFSMDDVEDRGRWDEYRHAYEEAMSATSTEGAPWYIVPADHRWFSALAVAEIVAARLEALELRYPPLKDADREQMAAAKKRLESE